MVGSKSYGFLACLENRKMEACSVQLSSLRNMWCCPAQHCCGSYAGNNWPSHLASCLYTNMMHPAVPAPGRCPGVFEWQQQQSWQPTWLPLRVHGLEQRRRSFSSVRVSDIQTAAPREPHSCDTPSSTLSRLDSCAIPCLQGEFAFP